MLVGVLGKITPAFLLVFVPSIAGSARFSLMCGTLGFSLRALDWVFRWVDHVVFSFDGFHCISLCYARCDFFFPFVKSLSNPKERDLLIIPGHLLSCRDCIGVCVASVIS